MLLSAMLFMIILLFLIFYITKPEHTRKSEGYLNISSSIKKAIVLLKFMCEENKAATKDADGFLIFIKAKNNLQDLKNVRLEMVIRGMTEESKAFKTIENWSINQTIEISENLESINEEVLACDVIFRQQPTGAVLPLVYRPSNMPDINAKTEVK